MTVVDRSTIQQLCTYVSITTRMSAIIIYLTHIKVVVTHTYTHSHLHSLTLAIIHTLANSHRKSRSHLHSLTPALTYTCTHSHLHSLTHLQFGQYIFHLVWIILSCELHFHFHLRLLQILLNLEQKQSNHQHTNWQSPIQTYQVYILYIRTYV